MSQLVIQEAADTAPAFRFERGNVGLSFLPLVFAVACRWWLLLARSVAICWPEKRDDRSGRERRGGT